MVLPVSGICKGGNGTGYTKYAAWYGGNANPCPWCAVFISWCAGQAGISTSIIPKVTYVKDTNFDNLNSFFQNAGRYSLRGSYTPKKGDIFLMTTGDDSHAGVVTLVASGYMTVIHGNTRESEQYYHVAQEVWSVTDTRVTGFGKPDYCYYGHDWHNEGTYYRCTVCGQTATTIINSNSFDEEE